MVNFWKLSYKSVKEQRDQYEAELLQCKSELHHYRAELESYKTNLKQRREERESMISDYQKKLDLVHMLKDEINELKQENERKDKLIEALKASESNLWHSSREFEEENRKLKAQRDNWEKEYYEVVDENDRFREVEEENEEYRKESEQLKIKNEYLLNVIKMSENIEIHSDAYDEMEKGENNKTHHIPHLTDIKTNKNIEEPMKFIKRIAKERADDER